MVSKTPARSYANCASMASALGPRRYQPPDIAAMDSGGGGDEHSRQIDAPHVAAVTAGRKQIDIQRFRGVERDVLAPALGGNRRDPTIYGVLAAVEHLIARALQAQAV